MVLTGGRLATLVIGLPVAIVVAAMGGFSAVGWFANASEQHSAGYDWHGGPITVSDSSGSVQIQAVAGSHVSVSYTEHYQLTRPTISATTTAGGGLQLTAKCPGGLLGDNCEINYVLSVPASAALVVHSGSGGLHITGVTGTESLDTGDGGITLENVSGAVTAHTGSGGIHGSQLRSASVQASTGDGGIQVDWATAPTTVVATTGSGGVHLTVPTGSGPYRVATHTGSGGVNVQVATDPQSASSINVRTGDGGIDVGYPG
jgi:hypothetical protein